MKKIFLNSAIRSTLNKKLIYNIISIEPAVTMSGNNDYIIEYRLFTKNVNGERVNIDDFTHKSYLSHFGEKEKKLLKGIITLKRAIEKENESKVVVAEMAYA
jgi:hypothetical protein